MKCSEVSGDVNVIDDWPSNIQRRSTLDARQANKKKRTRIIERANKSMSVEGRRPFLQTRTKTTSFRHLTTAMIQFFEPTIYNPTDHNHKAKGHKKVHLEHAP
jgi:hypothetical protein